MSDTTETEKPERLNKALAHAGYGSRRQVEELILAGRVSLDGRTVRELGTRVRPGQKITVDGASAKQEKLTYWLVYKPRGYLCTNFDPSGRPRVIDLVPQISQRVYTVGRLDENSEGLILLTNDGDLANRLMHPRFGVEKTYQVQVAGHPTTADLRQLLDGVWISEGRVRAKKVRRLKSQGASTWLRIILSEGKNREIRRMLAKLRHKVLALRRVAIGPIKAPALQPGKSRRLRGDEVQALRDAAHREKQKAKEHGSRSAGQKRAGKRESGGAGE
jgi:23S rRNA pseudouridine2605 synthase